LHSPGCSFRKIEQSLHALEHPEYLSGPSKMDDAKDSTQQAIFARFAGHWAITNLERETQYVQHLYSHSSFIAGTLKPVKAFFHTQ
jgi:hypothetical protein